MTFKILEGRFQEVYDQAHGNIATTKDIMIERSIEIGFDPNHEIWTTNIWTPEGFCSIENKVYGCLQEFNPLIDYRNKLKQIEIGDLRGYHFASDVLLNGKNAKEVILETAKADLKKPDSEKRVIELGRILPLEYVSTRSFDESRTMVFLARGKKLAQQYGLTLLHQANIDRVEVIYPNWPFYEVDFCNGLYLCGVKEFAKSHFYCDSDLEGEENVFSK
ncbi:hypothetical protein GOV12_04395 [Candidatus Pacearchaeota archaeon]|nr:hypothetical protein [Candidatus Pacearchaeota archaeon]